MAKRGKARVARKVEAAKIKDHIKRDSLNQSRETNNSSNLKFRTIASASIGVEVLATALTMHA